MTAGGVFDGVTSHPDVDRALSDHAVVAAMLRFEGALAMACAAEGLLPETAARAIVAHCSPEHVDVATLGTRARASGSPVIPLVEDLTAAVGEAGQGGVHRGSTTQDVVDTAASLLARDVGALVLAALEDAAATCAGLAEAERGTLLAGRTLGQHALPTTFGLKAAGWAVALWEVHDHLSRVLTERVAVQLGGAAGTLSGLGVAGPRVVARVAETLGLAEPLLPWHTNRNRVAELTAALTSVAGTWGKIALDLVLLSQTEVAEVVLERGAGQGSSAMPHKTNPVAAVLVRSAALRVPGLASGLFSSMHQEQERGAGTWQAEWVPQRELLRAVGATSLHGAELVASVRVDAARMRRNLDLTLGTTSSERLAGRMAPDMGRSAAQALVRELCLQTARTGTPLRRLLEADARVTGVLAPEEIEELMDPALGLGAADEFVARALELHVERSARAAARR